MEQARRRFSANLGFLWTDRALPDAIYAAKSAGFDAVECHWPYDTPVDDVRVALAQTGLPMLGLNTLRGDVSAGENGLAALPGRMAEARGTIDLGLDYGTAIGAVNLHVMAGVTSGGAAAETFMENLIYACDKAADREMTILIEPLNTHDAPGYFLQNTEQAIDIIDKCGHSNLKLMFDCYHVARTEGHVLTRFEHCFPHIGHVQFAGVPDRGFPDQGDVDYINVFKGIERLGWTKPLGAEYKPGADTDGSLGWMQKLQ